MIPKIVFQTSIEKPKQYVIDKILSKCASYEYRHFDDNEIIQFFKDNPLEEFKNIAEKFYAIPKGPHRADLFRYYFLYINGGVFIDSDAMIELNIDDIVKDYSFFSILSHHHQGDIIFQGFIGATPKNKIIYEALRDAYTINVARLKEFHVLCRNLYNIIKNKTFNFKYKLYEEEIWNHDNMNKNRYSRSYNDDNQIILKHYCIDKIVPK